MTMTSKMWEHLEKIATAQAEEEERSVAGFGGFSPREIARILWPDSTGWDKVSRRGSTPAGGARGATMPMKGARAANALRNEGFVYEVRPEYTHGDRYFISGRGRRALAEHLAEAQSPADATEEVGTPHHTEE